MHDQEGLGQLTNIFYKNTKYVQFYNFTLCKNGFKLCIIKSKQNPPGMIYESIGSVGRNLQINFMKMVGTNVQVKFFWVQ